MTFRTVYHSAGFASALLYLTIFGVLQTLQCCSMVSYVFLALTAYQLYDLFSSKKVEGKLALS